VIARNRNWNVKVLDIVASEMLLCPVMYKPGLSLASWCTKRSAYTGGACISVTSAGVCRGGKIVNSNVIV
jgi:hypothetical protein